MEKRQQKTDSFELFIMSIEPASKKIKLCDESSSSSKVKVIVDYMKQLLHHSAKNLKAVLSDELNGSVPMISIYVGNIKDPKNISKTIKILNEKIPLDGLSHLKRVRNNAILLCLPESLQGMSIQEFIETRDPELKNLFDYFKEILVPEYAPKLKKQHLEITRKWSCNFHPDAYLESLAGDSFFSEPQLELHRTCMRIAFEVALHHFKSSSVHVTEELFKEINVTVVLDPEIKSVVAIAVDNRSEHPVQHSAMIAIDNVAKTQHGGAWQSSKNNLSNSVDLNQSDRLSGIDHTLLGHLRKKVSSVTYGAKPFKSKHDADIVKSEDATGPYLCTNYYIYMLREPCLMCSMALVHARARTVFFCFDNPEGALKTKTKLHTLSSLNHRYEVFTSFL